MTKLTAELVVQSLKDDTEEGIDRDYMNRLLDGLHNFTVNEPANLADLATSTTFDPEFRARYLDELLRIVPGIEHFLFKAMTAPLSPITSEADQSRAALLYLRGDELGFWKLLPHNRKRAQSLIASMPEPEKAKEGIFTGRLRVAIMDDNGVLTTVAYPDQRRIRDFYIGAASNPTLSYRDRLFCQLMVLTGVEKKLWAIPEGWNPGISK